MKISKSKQQDLDNAYNTFIQVCLYDMPLRELEPYIPDDVMNFGAGVTEITTCKENFLKQIENQKAIASGLEMDFQISPVIRKIINEGQGAIYTDDLVNTVWMNGVKNELKFRLSSIFEYVNGKWFMIHSHTSAPDSQRNDDEVWPVEDLKRRTEFLEKSLEEKVEELKVKNRELEIESALERVRARSMAMHNSSEMLEVADVLFQQIRGLGVNLWGCGVIICQENADDDEVWFANEKGVLPPVLLPHIVDQAHKEMYQGWKNSLESLSIFKEGPELKEHYDYMLSVPCVKPLFESILDSGLSFPTWQKWHAAYFTYGYLLIITLDHYEEERVFTQFAKVFDQAYTRFLDLQKAEAQAREAQIETSLEKIRSYTLGMRTSEDLSNVATVMFDQLKILGGDLYSFGIVLCDEQKQEVEQWHRLPGKDMLTPFFVPKDLDYIHQYRYDQWVKGSELFSIIIPEDYITEHFEIMFALPSVNKVLEEISEEHLSELKIPTWEIDYGASFKHGYLLVSALKPFEEEHIFPRFAKVFEQAYTRFLDLQKAEAQAREAQIEVALEKVRSRTMAMHKAEELKEVVTVVVEKLMDLGVVLDANGVILCTYFSDSKDVLHWIASPDFSFTGSYFLPYFDHPIFRDAWESRLNGDEYFSKSFSVEDKNSFFEYAFEYSDYKHFPDDFKEWVFQNDKHSLSFAWSKNSAILIPSHTGVVPNDTDVEILKRFAKVFEQAYVRFMDLQKAEKSTRETQIELSLERIRAQVTSMQVSTDLLDIVVAMRNEFVVLGHEAHYFWHMRWLPDIYEKAMTSGDGSRIGMVMELPRRIHGEIKQLDEWEKSDDPAVIFTMDADAALDYIHKMIEWGDFQQVDHNVPTEDDIRHIGGLTYIMARTTHGEIGYSLPGVVPEPPQEAIDTLIRFAGVFDLAYRRFEDLRETESQKREAEIELALERVRSRTMAMQLSNELPEAANLLFLQVQSLDIPAWSAGYCIWEDEEKTSATAFMSSEGVLQKPFSIPTIGVGYNFYDPLQQGKSFHVEELGGDELVKHYEFMRTLPIFGEVIDGIIEAGFPLPTFQIFHIVYFPEGYLMFITYEQVPHAHDIFNRFSKVFEQTYTRFLDLKKAEAQTREAKIEAALEKVRSRTMAMQNSIELPEVANVLFQQVQQLGIPAWSAGYNILSKDRNSCTCIMSSQGQVQAAFHLPLTEEKSFMPWAEAIENDEVFFVQELGGKELEEHYEYLLSLPDIKDAVDPLEKAGISLPTYQINHLSFFQQGFLLFITYEKVPEAHEIFKRFTSVFEQTYARFLDLKRAEAQTREAQIETALERVRSRTMAMQHSDELGETSALLDQQVRSLGIETWGCAFNIYGDNESTEWFSSEAGVFEPYTVPRENVFLRYYETGQRGETLYIEEFVGEECIRHYEYLSTIPIVGDSLKKIKESGGSFPTYQIDHVAFFKHGYLLFITFEPVPEAHDVFKRFAKIFEQTYTRFIDLKTAEEQAREAQIEAALERTRSQSMMMQHSDELSKTSEVFHEQLNGLGIESEFSYLWLPNEEKEEHLFWATWQEEKSGHPEFKNKRVVYPLDKTEPSIAECYIAWEGGQQVHINTVEPKGVKVYFETWTELLAGVEKFKPVNYPDGLYYVDAYMQYGCFGIMIKDPLLEDDQHILQRFSKEFERAYTRFLDLQLAEKQTQQARIETALERVRARAMAMQEPEELKDVAQVLRNEMGALGIEELETCSIYIKDRDTSKAECWYALKDIRDGEKQLVTDHFHLDLETTWVGREMLEFYNSNDKKVSIVMKGEQRKEWINYCEKHSEPFQGYYGEVIPERTYHLYRFSNGAIGFASASEISEESWDILIRAASAFSLAYSRFQDLTQARIDLIKLKEEKKRAEDALTDLKEAQKQLIHAEKMASLGELTAGIAHEIQNPLNFVNNFSEVSNEMIDEVNEEIEGGDMNEAKEILQDIKGNLEKINHHGQRASGIVRSMLDHSRASSGEKVATDINSLCDEYLRLAYHGMRAKDRSFNADFETTFDESLPKTTVIPQDIGRVLLNLINNAFQAITDLQVNDRADRSVSATLTGNSKQKTKVGKVTIQTKNLGDKIEISVIDNGPGIPDNIMDKVFQPFFTTKPTGQGTGLGLSLSYDIVKAHGGTIELESNNKAGTTFIIILPIQSLVV